MLTNKKVKVILATFGSIIIIYCAWQAWVFYAYRIRGYKYYLAGDYERALKYWLTESRWENSAKVSNNIALCYKHLGNFTEEQKWREKSLKYNPKFEKVIVNLAECYESQGNIKDAITMWKKYLEIHPEYNNTYEKIFFLYMYERDMTGAKNFLYDCLSKKRINTFRTTITACCDVKTIQKRNRLFSA